MAKKLSGLLGNEFARLYCKEIGVVPDKGSARAQYADLGGSHSYMSIEYKVNGKYFDDMIEMMDVFNLISKHIL